MRIAIVGPTHPYKGGIAQHTTELAHRLAARGHDVRLESWSAQYPDRLYPGRQRVTEPELPPFPGTSYPLSWRRPEGWLRLGRRLRREVDAVVLVVVTPVQAPAYLGVLRGLRPRQGDLRVLALCHNVLPHERRAVDVPLTRAVLRRVSAVLVHTPAEAARARGLVPVPVSVAPMPPHLWISAAGPADGAAAPVRRRVLFFGMVRPYKGLDVLLRALAAGPADVALTVAGEFWGDEARTRELVGALGLSGRVELRPGYVDATAVPALFAGVDALVLPYRAATATQNVTLAHRHGVPVVATRVGALAEAVRDGVDGLLCAPDDVDALAAALRRLYEPGVLAGLRAKVEPPDAGAAWSGYLDVLVDAVTGGA